MDEMYSLVPVGSISAPGIPSQRLIFGASLLRFGEACGAAAGCLAARLIRYLEPSVCFGTIP
jgi:hypothetical protein